RMPLGFTYVQHQLSRSFHAGLQRRRLVDHAGGTGRGFSVPPSVPKEEDGDQQERRARHDYDPPRGLASSGSLSWIKEAFTPACSQDGDEGKPQHQHCREQKYSKRFLHAKSACGISSHRNATPPRALCPLHLEPHLPRSRPHNPKLPDKELRISWRLLEPVGLRRILGSLAHDVKRHRLDRLNSRRAAADLNLRNAGDHRRRSYSYKKP